VPQFELYYPKGIDRETNPEAVQNDGSRFYTPGYCLDIKNAALFSFESGEQGAAQPKPGTTALTLPDPVNSTDYDTTLDTCIGVVSQEEQSRMFIFLYSPTGQHRIIKFDAKAGTFTTICQGTILNFNPNYRVSENRHAIINDLLYWTDGLNPSRAIDVSEELIDPSFNQISYLKPPPRYAPTFPEWQRSEDTSSIVNHIGADNYQFCLRFIYKDNSYSVLSAFTPLNVADEVAKPNNTTRNIIKVRFNVDSDEYAAIKEVELIYFKNNGPSGFVVKSFKGDELQEGENNYSFNGRGVIDELSTDESIKAVEAIPRLSNNLISHDDRIFVTADKVGFDVDEDEITLDIDVPSGITLLNLYNNDPLWQNLDRADNGYAPFLKEAGFYSLGVILYDEAGRPSGVKKKTDLQSTQILSIYRAKIGGQVDPNVFKRFSLALSREKYFEIGMTVPTVPFAFLGDDVGDGIDNNTQFIWRGRVYNKNGRFVSNKNFYHFVLPTNIPFIPSGQAWVRWPNYDASAKVIDYFEDINAVVVDANDVPWDALTTSPSLAQQEIEIYSTQEIETAQFHENSQIFDLNSDGTFPDINIPVFGDYYKFEGTGAKFNFEANFDNWANITFTTHGFTVNVRDVFLHPVRTFGNTQADTDRNVYRNFLGWTGLTPEFETKFSPGAQGTLDYAKISGSFGRLASYVPNEQEQAFSGEIRYSNKFVQNSFINGLSVMDGLDTYQLPSDKGPVQALIRVQDIILAIFARESSSLYIGEGQLRAGADTLLAKVDNVIGDDREHARTYGTINPESVKEFDGSVFAWDGIEGVVWRYTSGGLIPISLKHVGSDFRKKARDYAQYDNIQVIGGIDPASREYLIHFPEVQDPNNKGEVLIEAETWAYQIDRDFWVRYEYSPECFGTVLNKLYTVKSGVLYRHDNTDNPNLIYGEQKYTEFTFIVNPFPKLNKRFFNIQVDTDNLADDITANDIAVRIRNPKGQSTYMRLNEFQKINGKFLSPVLKDVNTRVDSGKKALRHGNDIDDKYIELDLIFVTTKNFKFRNVTVVFEISPYTR
jgi:hypothetical protein